MTRVDIRKTAAKNRPKVEIRIAPQRGTHLRLLLAGAGICGLGVWLASRMSIVTAVIVTGLETIWLLSILSTFPADRVTLEDGYLFLQKQFLGIKSSKKLRLRAVSNLQYQRRPSARVPQPSIIFSASEELGVFQGFGLRLKEEEAQRIIDCIEEYRAELTRDCS